MASVLSSHNGLIDFYWTIFFNLYSFTCIPMFAKWVFKSVEYLRVSIMHSIYCYNNNKSPFYRGWKGPQCKVWNNHPIPIRELGSEQYNIGEALWKFIAIHSEQISRDSRVRIMKIMNCWRGPVKHRKIVSICDIIQLLFHGSWVEDAAAHSLHGIPSVCGYLFPSWFFLPIILPQAQGTKAYLLQLPPRPKY